MLKKIESSSLGKNNLDWLKASFHFSFGDYHNPERMGFGVLRVLNDDLIGGNKGFDTHPHRDMEIITYVIEGKLTHEDSMGNSGSIERGHVQYMSAGTGVYHSEYNNEDETIRSLQIWIIPDEKGHTPNYGDYKFPWELRKNKWLHMISSHRGDAPIKINQDANFYVTELQKGKETKFSVGPNRQAYLLQIEGITDINSISLSTRDALEIVEEELVIKAKETSHILVIEMAKP
ncbi:pirin family protein [Alkaliphilus serpentinus]|uniref:Pirin family protein n=1 Tax=Alkaliphilus serpentinus TaxID=1482731 RepID=A0A833M9Q7_9FIRM|nr:pirin family protein [Alkaliphilus serpentinus]KAB3530516.1 pirin family protein [Alkaliphilus serpentinus]